MTVPYTLQDFETNLVQAVRVKLPLYFCDGGQVWEADFSSVRWRQRPYGVFFCVRPNLKEWDSFLHPVSNFPSSENHGFDVCRSKFRTRGVTFYATGSSAKVETLGIWQERCGLSVNYCAWNQKGLAKVKQKTKVLTVNNHFEQNATI